MPRAKKQPKKAAKATKPPVPPKPGSVSKFLPPWQTGQPGPIAGEEDPDKAYDFRYVHPRIQAVRRLFVAEFVKDFNGSAALARLGFQYEDPARVANGWLKEPFTQHVLDKYIREAEDKALITRGAIIAGLIREANSYGLDSSGASRTSALGKLAKIFGMEIQKVEAQVTVPGGVILVPLAGTADEWEKNAAKAQADLKKGA